MTEQEIEMTDEKSNYEILAQIYTIINDTLGKKSIAMEKVLHKDFDINYSIPSSECALPNIAERTALDFALDKRELEVFNILIQRGANFTSKNRSGDTILHRMIEKSYVKNKQCYKLKGKLEDPFVASVLSAHIESNQITNPKNQNSISHFHIACMFDHTEAVKFFLAQGVYINQAIDRDSKAWPAYTPLHLAARYSAFETAKLLLDHNADMNLRDAQGLYPHYLLIQRNIEISDWVNLQKRKLCKKLKDELLINENMIKLLLKKNENNEDGLCYCHLACTLQDTRILEHIVTEGTSLNVSMGKNSSLWPGYTALHFAALLNINALRLLLKNGAHIWAKDANGITPLDLCMQRYSPETIHSIITDVPQLNKITFLNTNTKLSDLILAMSEKSTLRHFLQEISTNANMSLPSDSLVWPGYTILHIAIILSDRVRENNGIYEDTEYAKEKKEDDDDDDFIYYSNKESFKRIALCLTMGADVTIADLYNSTPLHLAFRLPNSYIVELLLKYHHKLVNVVDSGNLSHLHIACTIRQNDLVEKLLQTRVDVNQPIKSTIDYILSDIDYDYDEDIVNILHINPGWTCLHIAAATANEQLMKILMKYDGDLYAQDSFEMTAIHQILSSENQKFAYSVLLSYDYKDCVTSFGLTHLHVACFVGDLVAVTELLKHGSDIEARVNYNHICSAQAMSYLASFDGYTPVHFALEEDNLNVVNFLVKHGVNLLAKSADGSIPLYKALELLIDIDNYTSDDYDCYSGWEDPEEYLFPKQNTEILSALKLLKNKKIEKLIKKDSGITKLHIACFEVDSRKVFTLLKNGANANAQVHMDSPLWPGCTPLHILMIPRDYHIDEFSNDYKSNYHVYKTIKMIGKLLLYHGASVTLKNAKGNTPIHMAAELLWTDDKLDQEGMFAIGWILEGIRDFSVNPVDARRISHFDVACMSGQQEIVEKFLKKSVDVNRHFGHFTDRYGGFTPLHAASFYKNDTVVNVLLKYGANPNAKDFLGNTPFHTAAVFCRLSCILGDHNEMIYRFLLAAGADAKAENLWNERPLSVILRMNVMTAEALHIVLENRTYRLNVFNPETKEGLLGVALLFKSLYTSLEDQDFYQAIVAAPDINVADELGRTVIHNVVSVNNPVNNRWKNGSVKDYTDIIHGFVELDFDIDCQDNKGETALHKAARFSNYNAIIGLLMNGADINIVNARDKPAFAYIIQNKEVTEANRRSILGVCLLHVYKLQIAGLEVSNANQEIAAQIHRESISCLSEMQCCSNELENLKQHTIKKSYSITMYNILSKPITHFRMIVFLRDTIDEMFVTNRELLLKIYPQYAGLLQMQHRNIFIRSQLVDPAKTALSFLSGFAVPDLCSDIIFQSLNNKDFKQLIAATTL